MKFMHVGTNVCSVINMISLTDNVIIQNVNIIASVKGYHSDVLTFVSVNKNWTENTVHTILLSFTVLNREAAMVIVNVTDIKHRPYHSWQLVFREIWRIS